METNLTNPIEELRKEKSLKKLRLKMGWSQSDLARRLNTNLETIIQIESGYLEIPPDFQNQLTFLIQQADEHSYKMYLKAQADSILNSEGLTQIIDGELQNKLIL